MTLTDANSAAGIVAILLSLGNIIWAWISRPARDLEAKVDTIEAEMKCEDDRLGALIESRGTDTLVSLKEHDRRIQRVEDDFRHLPSKDDIAKLATSLSVLDAEVKSTNRVVHRLDDYLRNQSHGV